MQTQLDLTPPDGDFVAYIESLSAQVKLQPAALRQAPTRMPLNARPNTKPLSQGLSPAAQDIVAEVFKRRRAESSLSVVDKLDAIKRERAKLEPFTEPRDAWEARWQPVFQLVNTHRWLLLALVFAAYALFYLAKLLLWPQLGFAGFGESYALFGVEDLDAPLMWLFLGIAAVAFIELLYRLIHLARQASLAHATAPMLFWMVIAALALFEGFMSSSSNVGSVFFWLSLAIGTVSGALWRLVRGLRRGYLLLNDWRS